MALRASQNHSMRSKIRKFKIISNGITKRRRLKEIVTKTNTHVFILVSICSAVRMLVGSKKYLYSLNIVFTYWWNC